MADRVHRGCDCTSYQNQQSATGRSCLMAFELASLLTRSLHNQSAQGMYSAEVLSSSLAWLAFFRKACSINPCRWHGWIE